MPSYDVIVGNIGRTLTTTNAKEAKQEYMDYVRVSKGSVGRAAGETVTLLRDGEPFREYRPKELPESPTHLRTVWWRGRAASYEVVKSYTIRVDFVYLQSATDGELLWNCYYAVERKNVHLQVFDGNPCADPYLVVSGPVQRDVIRVAEEVLKGILQNPHLFKLKEAS